MTDRAGRVLEFTIGRPTPTLNTTHRWCWQKRRDYTKALSREIAAATNGKRPAEPFQKAHVRIVRYAQGREPDHDNLIGGTKELVDCLLPLCPRMVKGQLKPLHPHGLGIVLDDDPAHMIREVVAARAPRRESARTLVTITELLTRENVDDHEA